MPLRVELASATTATVLSQSGAKVGVASVVAVGTGEAVAVGTGMRMIVPAAPSVQAVSSLFCTIIASTEMLKRAERPKQVSSFANVYSIGGRGVQVGRGGGARVSVGVAVLERVFVTVGEVV